eukprot:3596028-Pyramimonas_sp.AAC.1
MFTCVGGEFTCVGGEFTRVAGEFTRVGGDFTRVGGELTPAWVVHSPGERRRWGFPCHPMLGGDISLRPLGRYDIWRSVIDSARASPAPIAASSLPSTSGLGAFSEL